jgi:hypothetical protein
MHIPESAIARRENRAVTSSAGIVKRLAKVAHKRVALVFLTVRLSMTGRSAEAAESPFRKYRWCKAIDIRKDTS